MNRVLAAMNTHGVHGEWVDDDILIYVDDVFRGKFEGHENGFMFCPTTMVRLDYNTLSRIYGALGKANKAKYREVMT